MRPSYRESSCDEPGRVVTILLFVITLMLILPQSVSAQSAITYELQAWNDACQGCISSGQGNLVLSGPVPVATNRINMFSYGYVPYYCAGVFTDSVVSDEYADVSAYVFFGRMGMSLNASASESPQYITEGTYPPCWTHQNPYKASVYSSAQLGVQDVLHVNVPGVPAGANIIYRFKFVWDIEITTTDPDNANAYVFLETWLPGANSPDEKQLLAPLSARGTLDSGPIPLQNGASYIWSNSIYAAAAASAGCLNCVLPPVEWVPKTSSRITAMNTTAIYIDVLTPGASYYSDSGTTYPTSDSVHLDISLAGTGSGSVKSSPPGIDCGLTCSAYLLPGTAVVLMAIPAADGSIFSGWGVDSTCTDGSVFMTTTKSCTATFDLCTGSTRAQIGSTNNYDSISLAYGGAATSGDTIKVIASNQQEGPIDFNSGKSVVLVGGYDCLFNNIVSYTVVTGSMIISTGDVTFENIVIL